MRKLISAAALTAICLAAALAALKAYDWHLMQRPAVIPDLEMDRPTMRTAEIYPYTGIHMQPRARETYPAWHPSIADGYDVRSGQYGFWIDHNLENWPAKQPGEIRILLVGGSGAQGWGARTNDAMLYKLLPKALSRPGCRVEVINLAMGSTVSYQNFIALNRWGHALEPDAILSLAGANELNVPWNTKTDDAGAAQRHAAFERTLNYAYSPPWLKALAEWFPGLVKRTDLGNVVRMLALKDYQKDWQHAYASERLQMQWAEIAALPHSEIVRRIGAPEYRHALESMARDFPGIPVFGVFQPLNRDNANYKLLRAEVAKAKGIAFYDLQEEWSRKDNYPGSLVDTVHLSDDGQRLITGYLAAFLEPFVDKACKP
jgi:lysophospholipase L1-like esterase